jgi:teichuronic acid exporter
MTSNSSVEPIAETDAPIGSLAVQGVLTLLMRTGMLHVVNLLAGIVLARLLAPSDYGVFAIVTGLSMLFSALGSLGFSAAAIQRKSDISREQLSSLFWVQFTLAGVLVAVAIVVADPVAAFFKLGESGIWLIRAAAIALLLDSSRAMASASLERHLQYKPLALAEFVEGFSFQLAAMLCAFWGMGVWSLVCALLASRIAGLAMLIRVSDWRPMLAFDRAFVAATLPFGLYYQASTLISRFKDTFNPFVVGSVVGAAGAGYIGWATSLASLSYPLTMALWRVTFPTFSRLQDDRRVLERALSLCIRGSAATILPMSALLMVLAEPLTLVVFDPKWLPALPSFYLLTIAMWPGVVITATFFNLFVAVGRSDLPFRFAMYYLVFDWALGIPLVWMFGFVGVAIRSVIVAYVSLPIILHIARNYVMLDLRGDITPYVLRTALATLATWIVIQVVPVSLLSIALSGTVGIAVYIIWAYPLLARDLLPLAPFSYRRHIDRVLNTARMYLRGHL